MVDLLANSRLFTHPADTEQHECLFGVVFLMMPDEYKSDIQQQFLMKYLTLI